MLGGVLIKKTDRKKFSRDVEEFFLKQTGIKIKYDELERDNYGKILPFSGWQIGVSNSEDFLAVAVFPASNVGIDIEASSHEKKLSKRLLEKVLRPDEKMVDGSFLNNFVIKEAYSKYLGVGLSMGFSKYDANDLLLQEGVVWKKYSTKDYSCYVVRDII